MQMRFNEKKTTQAAAFLLKLAGGSMNYMKLIKLLYLGDRGALLAWGRPISGDEYVSMKLGPVLSEVHDLITEQPAPGKETFWTKYVSVPANYEVALNADPGDDELSRAEARLLDDVFAAYGRYKPFELVELLHKALPEWKERGGHIEYREILKAVGKSDDEIREIESELLNVRFIESVLRIA